MVINKSLKKEEGQCGWSKDTVLDKELAGKTGKQTIKLDTLVDQGRRCRKGSFAEALGGRGGGGEGRRCL